MRIMIVVTYEIFVFRCVLEVKRVHTVAGLPRLAIALVEASEEGVSVVVVSSVHVI